MHPIMKVSAVLSYVFLVAVLALVAWFFSARVDQRATDRNKARQAELIAGCERGNIVRGYLLLRAREVRSKSGALAPKVLWIIDCARSVPQRTYLPLTVGEQRAYLRRLAQGQVPLARP